MRLVTDRTRSWVPSETGLEERARWIRAVQAAVCAIYSPTDFIQGVMVARQCQHLWCQGAIDVYDRIMRGFE